MRQLLIIAMVAATVPLALSCFGGDSGTTVTGPSAAQKRITELEGELADICPTCEAELKRKLFQAQKCRAFTCDFEVGGLCNWKSGGKPGLPPKLYQAFVGANPQYGDPLGSTGGDEDFDAATKGDEDYPLEGDGREHEQLGAGGPKTGTDTIKELGLTEEEVRLAQNFLSGNTGSSAASNSGGAAGLFGDLFGGRRRHFRSRRQTQSAIERQFALQQALARRNAAGGSSQAIAKLEQLGIRVPVGAREGEAIAAKLAEKNKIPPSNDGKPVESDVTWGVFNQQFGNEVSGVPKAARGSFFATTWTKPGERAVLQSYGDFSETMYLYFDAWEATEDVSLKMCCDRVDRCVAATPYEEPSHKDTREWRKKSGSCPKGTRSVLFVCDNVGSNMGACGIDHIELFNANGMNICQGIDLLAGTSAGESPDSVDKQAQGAKSAGDGDEQAEQNAEIARLLAELRGTGSGASS